jgi:hypothetical protein
MAWPRLTPLDFTLTQGRETTKTRAAIVRLVRWQLPGRRLRNAAEIRGLRPQLFAIELNSKLICGYSSSIHSALIV